MKILIYSFEKFGVVQENPALSVANHVARTLQISNKLIILPVTYDCDNILMQTMHEFAPDFILGFGVAVGSNKIRVEKIALNYKHAEKPDNLNTIATLEKIDDFGSLSYETNEDVIAFKKSLLEQNIPTDISLHAGTYICNLAYYCSLKYAKEHNARSLFIHVPVSPECSIQSKIDVPTFPGDLIAQAVCKALLKIF